MAEHDPLALLQPAAARVRDPVSGRSMWHAGMVQNPRMHGADLQVDLAFEAAHSPEDRQGMTAALEAGLRALGYEGKLIALHSGAPPSRPQPAQPRPERKPDPVPGMTGPGMGAHGGPVQKEALRGVRHILAVASGKGGVGKSTIAVNLAVGLHRLGHEVGLLDADIYGPSVPTMMRASARPMVDPTNRRILPVTAHGVRCLSMGQLVDPAEAMIWRGPMVMSAVRQFLRDATWDGVDYLVVDLPPGTGDAQLTLIQAVDLAGAVIVTTPQPVALADAVRGITMFEKLEVPLLGLVENMAYYSLPDGTRDHVFGEGGGRRTAEQFGVPLLAEIPLQSAIREGGDAGRPVVLGDGPVADALMELARRVAAAVPVAAA